MFAPHCPTCRSRQLLSASRVVASAWDVGGPIHVRCWCGTIVAADAGPPVERPLREAS